MIDYQSAALESVDWRSNYYRRSRISGSVIDDLIPFKEFEEIHLLFKRKQNGCCLGSWLLIPADDSPQKYQALSSPSVFSANKAMTQPVTRQLLIEEIVESLL